MTSLFMIAMIGIQVSSPGDTLPLRPEVADLGPSYAKVALMTVGGGAVVSAGAGLLLAAGASGGDQSGFVSPTSLMLGLGLIVGYPVGAGLGASRAAGIPAKGPLIASMLAAGLGVGAWVGIGDGFDDETAADSTPWVVGAATGLGIHFLITSIYAHHAGRREAEKRARSGPKLSLYPVNRQSVGVSISYSTR